VEQNLRTLQLLSMPQRSRTNPRWIDKQHLDLGRRQSGLFSQRSIALADLRDRILFRIRDRLKQELPKPVGRFSFDQGREMGEIEPAGQADGSA
jgi:hypothetical protein